MFLEKSPIKFREIIIAGLIGLTLLILGCVYDQQLTLKVYDPINTNAFGIIFSGIAELPICFALCFGGASLIKYRPTKVKKVWTVFSIILGVLAIGFSLYYIYDTWMDFATFETTKNSKTLIQIFGILFSLLFDAAIFLFVFFKTEKFDKRNMFIVGLFFIAFALTISLLSTAGKYMWSRPRPRYLFAINPSDPMSGFKTIFELSPLAALENSELKSFPSGHSVYATSAMFVLPLLTLISEKTKDNRKLQIILFYIGLLWALVSMFSRIFAGAHFLSDVSAGFGVTWLVGFISIFILFKKREIV